MQKYIFLTLFVIIFSACNTPKSTNSTDTSNTLDETNSSNTEVTFIVEETNDTASIEGTHNTSAFENTETGNTSATKPHIWENQSFSTQEDAVIAKFTAKPLGDNIDTVMGFSEGAASQYSDLGIIVRFAKNGNIDARNGSEYTFDNQIKYSKNQEYRFKVEINFHTHTYDVWVTPKGEEEVLLGDNFSFRTEQNSMMQINNLAHYSQEIGAVVGDVALENPEDTTPPVITLKGLPTVTLMLGDTYTDAGATATDNIDGDITTSIVSMGTVETDAAGSYTLTYTVADESGNTSEVKRTVVVTDTTGIKPTVQTTQVAIPQKQKVLVIGDSFTDGSDFLIPMKKILKDKIQFIGTKNSGGLRHEGRAGWTAKGYLNENKKWYPDSPFLNGDKIDFKNYFVNKLKDVPDTVIVELGLNDALGVDKGIAKGYFNESAIAERVNDIVRIVKGLQGTGYKFRIFVTLPTMPSAKIITTPTYKAIMEKFRKEFLAKFESMSEVTVIKPVLDTNTDYRDHVHMNAQGWDKLGKQVADAISKNAEISSTLMPTNTPTANNTSTDLGKLIFDIDFNKRSVGKYTLEMGKEDFYKYKGENLYYKNADGSWMYGMDGVGYSTSIVQDDDEKVLRVEYPKGRFDLGNMNDKAHTYTGMQSLAALPKKNRPKEDVNHPQTVTLIYYFKFEDNWDMKVLGGKLPGLAGGIAPAGHAFLGSKRLSSGFTARFMWHLLDGEKRLGMIDYIYHIGRKAKNDNEVKNGIYGGGPILSTTNPAKDFYERNHKTMLELVPNKWYKVQESITPNTPYKSDGHFSIKINDKLAADFGNMKIIADGYHGKYTVDRFLFSTFCGGGTARYAPRHDMYARFKGIKIYVK